MRAVKTQPSALPRAALPTAPLFIPNQPCLGVWCLRNEGRAQSRPWGFSCSSRLRQPRRSLHQPGLQVCASALATTWSPTTWSWARISLNGRSFTVTAPSTELGLHAAVYHSDGTSFQGAPDVFQSSSTRVFVPNTKAIHQSISERCSSGSWAAQNAQGKFPTSHKWKDLIIHCLSFYKLRTIAHTPAIVPSVDTTNIFILNYRYWPASDSLHPYVHFWGLIVN